VALGPERRKILLTAIEIPVPDALEEDDITPLRFAAESTAYLVGTVIAEKFEAW
jgi:hypothetical protein